ncbi:MAG TPA: (2Fe-2S)-binding protein [Methylomirabilota bacterium]|jgi:carbon-monoxide dehydrogenase small subunit
MTKRVLSLTVNQTPYAVEIPPNRTLLGVLRDELGLLGTKDGCSQGVCGACTVLVDGLAVRACLMLALRTEGRQVMTVEGLAADAVGSRLQEVFAETGAVQCGFCTPGMLMAARALLDEHPRPSAVEVREALVGNLCRCTGYAGIVRGVLAARGTGP